MTPRVLPGQTVTLEPTSPQSIKKGDVVLVRVRGRIVLHLVSAVEPDRVQISNNHGHVNGWVARTNVYGRLRK